jgi:putative membrane protein
MIRTIARPVLAAVAVAALVAACSQQQTDKTTADAGAAVNAAQDATSTAVGQTSAATMGANTVSGFVTGLAVSDMYELEAAKIAYSKSSSADVKALAAMITTDHTASSAKLKALAPTAAPTVALPTALDERRQGLIDNLKAATPADFDKVYLTQQVAAHDEALTLLNGFDDNTEAPTLASLAREIIPKVTAHRDHAKALADAIH